MKNNRYTKFAEVMIHYYEGVVLFGVLMVAVAIWLYEYYYTTTGDDLIGLASAAALFFGTMLLGQGIRGWRDGEEYRHRFIKMKSRMGAEVTIRKRRKGWFR